MATTPDIGARADGRATARRDRATPTLSVLLFAVAAFGVMQTSGVLNGVPDRSMEALPIVVEATIDGAVTPRVSALPWAVLALSALGVALEYVALAAIVVAARRLVSSPFDAHARAMRFASVAAAALLAGALTRIAVDSLAGWLLLSWWEGELTRHPGSDATLLMSVVNVSSTMVVVGLVALVLSVALSRSVRRA